MRDPGDPATRNDRQAGELIVAQWYLDATYEAIESLPNPGDDPGGFDAAVAEIERQTKEAVVAALAEAKSILAQSGVVLTVADR